MENDWFDAVAAREWLENRIERLAALKETDDFNSQIGAAITPDYVHVTNGIDILADILGKKLAEDGAVDEYTRYCFWHDGVKVLQLSKERLVKHDGAD